MKRAAIFLIELYQMLFSAFRAVPCCKYYPSCSDYAKSAFIKHGFVKGALKSIWRIIRCNPLSRGGVDIP